MKSRSRHGLVLLGLLLGVTGCGDGPEEILRDAKNAENESADVLSQVTDEASGEWAAKNRAKTLKEKFTSLKERLDKYLKTADDSQKAALALTFTGKQFKQEFDAIGKRLKSEQDRVRLISFSDSQVKDTITKWIEQTEGTQQQPPMMPQSQASAKATPHKCEACGAVTGIGGDGTLLTFCPNCGARLRGIAPWIFAVAGGAVFGLAWLVIFLIKKQSQA